MNRLFKKISDIVPEAAESWKDSLFLTFDIDWACDEVLADTISLVEAADVPATWFVTHETPMLRSLRANPNFELGIHPNFNKLLQGDPGNGADAEEVVDRLLEVVPEAVAVRSHSLVQSTPLHHLFKKKKICRECNCFIPAHAGMDIKPWRLWKDYVITPLFWEDDLALMYALEPSVEKLAENSGLKIYNFHPIHVFLNTERLERYEESRRWHRSPEELLRFRNTEGGGTRTALQALLELKR